MARLPFDENAVDVSRGMLVTEVFQARLLPAEGPAHVRLVDGLIDKMVELIV